MHSIACYRIRCYNKDLKTNEQGEKYHLLDDIRSSDIFDILKEFIQSHLGKFINDEDRKSFYQYSNFNFDSSNRIIHGYMRLGYYGLNSDIVNVQTGDTDFNKSIQNADMLDHLIYINLPPNQNRGLIFFHRIRGNGTKTLFSELFKEFFRIKTSLVIQINPITLSNALAQWNDAVAKEINLIGYRKTEAPDYNDLADYLKNYKNHPKSGEVKITLTPPDKYNYGTYKDFFQSDNNLVEILTPIAKKVTVTFDKNGRKRVFTFGHNQNNAICDVELPHDLINISTGNLNRSLALNWCNDLAKDILK